MTLPTIYPSGYNGTSSDFSKVKADRSGALRSSVFTVTVPTSTATSTVIGFVPVRKGARLHLPACRISIDDLDSGTTITSEIGIVYDDATNNTSVPDKYVADGATTGQSAGAFTLLTTNAADSYVVTGDGWLALTLTAGPTTTLGTIHGVAAITYDASLQ